MRHDELSEVYEVPRLFGLTLGRELDRARSLSSDDLLRSTRSACCMLVFKRAQGVQKGCLLTKGRVMYAHHGLAVDRLFGC